jgi:hypothetical protein
MKALQARLSRREFGGALLGLGALALGGAERPATKPSPLDEPLRLIAAARASYAKVRDYTCTFIKREKLDDTLGPANVMFMKARSKPFSVGFIWLEPKDQVGQEAYFVAGKNDGKMRAKAPGLLGSFGFVSIPTDDQRARKTSRHSITEAGLGNLIARFGKAWEEERHLGRSKVKVGTYEYAKRRCTRVEATHTGKSDGKFQYYRSVVYFDKQNGLPIRVENYAWPKKPGQAGELLEMYCYVNLRLNPGLPDDAFDK